MFLILNNDLGKEMEEVAQSNVLSWNVPAAAVENHDKPQPVQSVLAKKQTKKFQNAWRLVL